MHKSRLHPLLRAKRPATTKTRRQVSIRAEGNVAYIDIYGDIGASEDEHILASDVLNGLRGVDADIIELRINSQGGDSFDGIAIYNDLRANRAEKRVVITGIAASAASIIAMAGDHIAIADGAQILIHNAWCTVSGDAAFLEKTAKELRANAASMARIYVARTGIPLDQIQQLMDAETLLTAQEALDLGFVDEIIAPGGTIGARIVKPGARMRPKSQAIAMNDAAAALERQMARGLCELAAEIRRTRRVR